MERLTEQMKRAQGITEQLKTENALEWTQRMNNIRACAKEIIEKELIQTLLQKQKDFMPRLKKQKMEFIK